MFVLLITGYFKVLYYTGQNRSGFKVSKLKSASFKVYSRPLCKINSDYNTWALLSQKFYPFFFFLLFVLHSSALYNEISGMLLWNCGYCKREKLRYAFIKYTDL